jgi:muconate cycloisomerase
VSRIASLEIFHVALPPRREHKWAGLTEAIGGYILVKLTDDAGETGWGEAPALKDWGGDFGRYFGESPRTVIAIIEDYLLPAVKGAEVGDMVDLHARMDRIVKGYPYAKAAIDMAAYDLAGRSLGVSAAVLLGGFARRHVPITHSIGLLGFEEAELEVAQLVKEGIRTIKIKVGVDPERDVEMVRRVRDVAGPDMVLCADANQGYESPREAIRTVKRMEPFGLKYFEQPVEGITRMAEVARAIDTPVMADESAWNSRDALEIAIEGGIEIISIYITKPGGLHRALDVASICRAAGIRCNINGSIETGVGNRANVILAAASSAVTLSCVIPVSVPAQFHREGSVGGIYYKDDLLTEAMPFEDGGIVVSDRPGLGWDVDPAKVALYPAAARQT